MEEHKQVGMVIDGKEVTVDEGMVKIVSLFNKLGVTTIFSREGGYNNNGMYRKAYIAFKYAAEYYALLTELNKQDTDEHYHKFKNVIDIVLSSVTQELWSRYATELGKFVPSYSILLALHEKLELERLLSMFIVELEKKYNTTIDNITIGECEEGVCPNFV